VEQLSLNIPDRLKKLISDVITVLLTKINVPHEEIEDIVEKIEQRGIKEMFAIENYDVQETRRTAMDAGKAEGKIEGKIEVAASIVSKMKISVSEAMRLVELPEDEQIKVIAELKKRNIPYDIGQ
jgi:cytosine/adenosine deaminase-related metal-dependent hydrolase